MAANAGVNRQTGAVLRGRRSNNVSKRPVKRLQHVMTYS